MTKSWRDYSVGERFSSKALDLALRPNIDPKKQELVRSYKDNPDDMDLRTICKIEAALEEEILIIPTKQQWRKIKLQQINDSGVRN
jgi:hypothetical protein